MNKLIKEIFYRYSKISRQKKVKLFFDLMNPQKDDILVDVGGGLGDGFREIWGYFRKVIVVDINEDYIKKLTPSRNLQMLKA